MTLASELIDYALGLKFDDLPEEVVLAGKKVVLDTLGVLIQGSSAPGMKTLLDIVRSWGGSPESSVLVFGDAVPAPMAALINGAMARSHDFDEFHERAMVHSAASVVPACLAVAEKVGGVQGKDFLTAVVLGIDVADRLGLSLKRNFLTTGLSISPQFGTFGIALAAGKLLGLDREQMSHALGIAYSQVAGNLLCAIEGTMMVHIQIGLCAQAGIVSSLFAQKGITGPREVLEGKFGYFNAYHQDQYDPSIITRNLGREFEITRLSIKYFPCCLCTHAAISAMLQLAKEERLNPQEVDRIRVRVNQGSYNVVCQPLEKKRNPGSFKEALFSLPYAVASALVRGHVSLEDFTPQAIQDEAVRSMANRITPFVDKEIEEQHGRTLGPAVVEITMKNGRTSSRRVAFVKGHPNNPMTMEDCEEKFQKCVPYSAKALDPEKVTRLLESVKSLESMEDVSTIANFLK